jgi:hypothetical protein
MAGHKRLIFVIARPKAAAIHEPVVSGKRRQWIASLRPQ